jgi:hypothetical protein
MKSPLACQVNDQLAPGLTKKRLKAEKNAQNYYPKISD